MIKTPVEVIRQPGIVTGSRMITDSAGNILCANLKSLEAKELAIVINAHDSLVAALEKVAALEVSSRRWGDDGAILVEEAVSIATEALKLAKGDV